MAKGPENDGGVLQRRVYALSPPLVARIEQFQKRKRLSSETEAVRVLLDKALNDEDDYGDLVERFINDFKETEDLTESAKNILLGHPLVKSVSIPYKWSISFEVKGFSGDIITVVIESTFDGNVSVKYFRDGKQIDLSPF